VGNVGVVTPMVHRVSVFHKTVIERVLAILPKSVAVIGETAFTKDCLEKMKFDLNVSNLEPPFRFLF